jgi:hypothetical protein
MSDDKERLGAPAYVIGGLAFIPLVGVPFGIAAIVWGLVTGKSGGKLLALLGAGGIAFTVLLYGGLFYLGFIQRGGIYDEMRRRMAQTQLNSLVPTIEFHKVATGAYPRSLEELQKSQPKNSFVFVIDPIDMTVFGRAPRPFYYERVGEDHYYLRSAGLDGAPFTDDDVVPQVNPSSAGKLGLLIDKR